MHSHAWCLTCTLVACMPIILLLILFFMNSFLLYSNDVCRTLSLCSDHLLNITLDFDQNYEERNARAIKHVWGADSVFYSFFRFYCVMRMDIFYMWRYIVDILMESGVCHSVQDETHMAEPQQQQQEYPRRVPLWYNSIYTTCAHLSDFFSGLLYQLLRIMLWCSMYHLHARGGYADII